LQERFDKHQFANRRPHPVTAASDGHGGFTSPGIAFEDFSRMSSMQRKTTGVRRLPTPKWAVNDKELQHLLTVFMEGRAGFRKHKDPLIETKKDLTKEALQVRLERAKAKVMSRREGMFAVMKKLNEEYVRIQQQHPLYETDLIRLRQLENEIQGIDTYLRYSENGGADIVAAIVYMYYRTGMDSVGVSAELGIKPPHVRQTLWRLHRVADRIAGIKRVVPTKEEREARKLARAERLRLEAEDRAARAVERTELARKRMADTDARRVRAAAEEATRKLREAEREAQRIKPKAVTPGPRVRSSNLSKGCFVCGGPLPYHAQKLCSSAECQQTYIRGRNRRRTQKHRAKKTPLVPMPVLKRVPRWLEAAASAV
jgi:hypothetical protein